MIRRRMPAEALAAAADKCSPMPLVAVSTALIHGRNAMANVDGRLSVRGVYSVILVVRVSR